MGLRGNTRQDMNLLDEVYRKLQQEAYRISGPPRHTTPLQDIDADRFHPETVAYDYEDRVEEYQALLTRRATRMMCETFYLSCSRDTGIWLEMKDDIPYE
ncbi:hypothetical protein VNI00_014870 [Paramarasmius palmivorus]|uniref:Uncharacterized protein n=1 Tax=Paramarasmius palmivorus TaxID=297713 RepID=A0AAW0BS00_9AGAR